MITTIATGDGSRIVEPRRTTAGSEAEWRALWAAHAGPNLPAPSVDFATRMVAAVFAGERPTPGHTVEITDARLEGGTLTIGWRERTPDPGAFVAQMIVTPFHIVSLPRHRGDVRFATVTLKRSSDSAAAAPAAGSESSSTGLAPNVAAALAYLAGPFSGATILLAENRNRYVRFHAWQAIIGLGSLMLLAVALLGSAFLALFVSPFAFTLMYRLSAVVGVVWLVAWGVCLYQAYTGRAWQLPLVGAYAARRR